MLWCNSRVEWIIISILKLSLWMFLDSTNLPDVEGIFQGWHCSIVWVHLESLNCWRLHQNWAMLRLRERLWNIVTRSAMCTLYFVHLSLLRDSVAIHLWCVIDSIVNRPQKEFHWLYSSSLIIIIHYLFCKAYFSIQFSSSKWVHLIAYWILTTQTKISLWLSWPL